jgi:hypothetical protein
MKVTQGGDLWVEMTSRRDRLTSNQSAELPSHVQESSVRGLLEGPSQPEKLSLLATTEDRENAANESITRSHTPSSETA